MKNEIIIYQADELQTYLEVRIDDETVWLNRHQIATLFGRDIKTVGKHINNIFSEGELIKEVVVAKFSTTTKHGAIKGKQQTIMVEHYNLDVIISVGYRVKSKQGTQFRIWANKILKDYLLKGYAINKRFERLEEDVHYLKEKSKDFDIQIKTSLPPNEGIFYDGQIFDAYIFVSNLIKSAKSSLILIDNYINESVLNMFAKRNKDVKAVIYTRKISNQLQIDIEKYNKQYPVIEVKLYEKSHDRFLIIDKSEIYHIGASLKDLGKKWFAFSKINLNINEMIEKVKT